jgi:hypothetical protein
MLRTIAITAFTLAIAANAQAFAGPSKGNTEARAMSLALKGGGGGNNSPLKEALSLTGNGGVASYVSGNKSVLGTEKIGGWGSIGSTLTGEAGVSVSGR